MSGNINAKYQDMAEWVESSQQLAAGTVVILDSSKSNQVIVSIRSYDSRGAGVIGDLLVTSNKEGVAMKSVPVEIGGVLIHRPGTLIGKALEPWAQGTGEILVLLSMQ